ncbi:D-aminoacyl-tRNA deacylase [Salinicola sp. LHM]|uniref:D-aminoacyl-tRNA deacylase n=1 Tax=Salinicola TaxID=404432 RepID=UPI0008DE7352|nr:MULTISPECIES: D-aminoacyl-tRNA deacylase [Salinicola]MDF3917996.1 D-aminoacyl-tRNA deacylase [Salinicola salarius]OHZ02918.1 D-tyrosyl-tRNA(Tyr) deacylase [Salinicola sp. MIT1003]WQH32851.1 D-aminoacyl-tRNA deacylase [Salinicola sp. LHM]
MRALIQRVSRASVDIDGETVGRIDQGLLALIGIAAEDDRTNADRLLHKLLHYRVFADGEGRMNCNLQQIEGGLLLVSQFTLVASTDKGLRPSFSSAAPPAHGQAMFDYLVEQAQTAWPKVATGRFGADMQVELINDGPVTFMLET